MKQTFSAFFSAILATFLLFSGALYAEQTVDVKFRSRAVFDVGYFGFEPISDRVYPSFTDLRMGAGLSMDNVSFKADVGLAGKAISLKDVIAEWKINPKNILRVGSTFEAFGNENLVSSVDITFNTFASATSAIGLGRRMGGTYIHNGKNYYTASGIYSDNDINDLFKPISTSSAMAVSTRHVYRTKIKHNTFVQVGMSLSARNIDQKKETIPSWTFCTKGFAAMMGKNMLETTIAHAKAQYRTGIEFMSNIDRFRIQAEYLYAHVARHNNTTGNTLNGYNTHGGYVQCSYILTENGRYTYDSKNACTKGASDKSLELNTRLEYLDMDCENSNIYGGQQTNITLGLNWYFHKLFAIKWNANYAFSGNNVNPDFKAEGFSTVARIQFIY